MKQYLIYIFLIFCCSLGVGTMVHANDETRAYEKESLNLKSFDAKEWSSETSGIRYSKKKKTKKIKKKKASTSTGTGTIPPPRRVENPFTFKDFAQTMLILLAIILLAYVIFKAVAGDAILVNKQVNRKKIHTLADIETNLHEADVESFLEKALAEKDYRLAIRLYYLAIIKELSMKGAISWKKDKTNGHYLREMRSKNHPNLKSFRNVTRIFEYVWYSNMKFDSGQFQEVRVNFKDLLTAIK